VFTEMILAGMVSLSHAEREADFGGPHRTLRDCGSEAPRVGACRMPMAMTPADVETHLAGKDTAWWRDGDAFIVVAKRDTDQAYLCCSIRAPMDQVSGDLWALRVRVADLDKATIDVFVQPSGATYGAYRGPLAPPRPEFATALKGQLLQMVLKSDYLDAPRNLTIYLPPGHDPKKSYPVVYTSDGADRQDDAKMIEPAILKGEIPPVIVVMIWQGGAPGIDLRSEEYLLGWRGGGLAFRKHESFLLNEVLPAMEKQYGASSDPRQRLITGFSSGASWAATMGLRHPDVFPNVAAQSMVWSQEPQQADVANGARFYLSAGTLEPTFLDVTTRFAERAKASGHDVTMVTTVSGHTQTIWRPLLLDAIKWAFGNGSAKKP